VQRDEFIQIWVEHSNKYAGPGDATGDAARAIAERQWEASSSLVRALTPEQFRRSLEKHEERESGSTTIN
jgi:hypothetical protein